LAGLLLNSFREYGNEIWSDMFALQEVIQKFDGIIVESKIISADLIYRDEIRNHGKVVEPLSLRNKCKFFEEIRAIHFSHSACKVLEFCDRSETIGKFLPKFIRARQEQCTSEHTK